MTNQTKTTLLFLLPFYLFWLIQILPKSCQLVVYAAWVIAAIGMCVLPRIREARQGRKQRWLDAFAILQLVYILLHGISMVVNAPQGHEINRILAACNTWGITVLALCAYLLYKESGICIAQIGKACLVNLLILDGMALLSLTRYSDIWILGRALRGFDIINEVETTRFLGFMEYSNLVVFFVLFMYPAAVEQLRGHAFLSVVFSVVTYGAMLLTRSRTGMVMIPVLMVMYYLSVLYERRVIRIPVRWLVLGGVCLVAVVGVLFHGQILSIIGRVYTMRSGSNSSRSIIYTVTLERIQESPIIGVGIKDAIAETDYTYVYGSHSSYLGAFYKAGVIGGIVYLASFVVLAVNLLRRCRATRVAREAVGDGRTSLQSRALTVTYLISFALVFALMILEDLDGADWLIMVTYSLFGMYVAGQREDVA